jgi:hypothetical protein
MRGQRQSTRKIIKETAVGGPVFPQILGFKAKNDVTDKIERQYTFIGFC